MRTPRYGFPGTVTKRIVLNLVVAAGAFGSMSVFAQELTTPPPPASTATTSSPMTPPRGASMEDVKAKFGAPSQQMPSVGQPPITRWEYPGYVVFFENDRVLHTVLVRS